MNNICNPVQINDIHPTILKDAVDSFRTMLFQEIAKSGHDISQLVRADKNERINIFEDVWKEFATTIYSPIKEGIDILKIDNPTISDNILEKMLLLEIPDLKEHSLLLKQKDAFLQTLKNNLADFDLKLSLKEQSEEESEDKESGEINGRDGVLIDKFSVDTTDLVDTQVKLMLSSLLKKGYDDRGNVIIKTGYFGLPQSYEFEFVNRTIGAVALETKNIDDIFDKLDKQFKYLNGNYKKDYLWIPELKERLKRTEGSIVRTEDEKIIAAFESQMRSYSYVPIKLIIDNEEGCHFTDVVSYYESKDIKDGWKNNVLSAIQLEKPSLFIQDGTDIKIDRTSGNYKRFIDKKNETFEDYIDKLALLGIELDHSILDNPHRQITFANGKKETMKHVVEEAYKAIVYVLEQEGRTFRDTYEDLMFGKKGAGSSYKEGGIQGRLNGLAQIQNELTPSSKRFMSRTPEGKNKYNKQSQSVTAQISIAFSEMKNISEFPEVFSALYEQRYFNPNTSLFAKNMFDINGNRKPDAKFKILTLEGVGKEDLTEGKGEVAFSSDERLLTTILLPFEGRFLLGMNADKTTSYVGELSKPLVSWEDSKDGYKIKEVFDNLLRDELSIAWRELKTPLNVAEFSNNVFKLGVFDGILPPEKLTEVIDKFFGEYLEYDKNKPSKNWKFKRKNVEIGDDSVFLDKVETYLLDGRGLFDYYKNYLNKTAGVIENNLRANNLIRGVNVVKLNFKSKSIQKVTGLNLKEGINPPELKDICRFVGLNHFVASLECDKLFFGNTAYYKDSYKRWNMFMAIKMPLCQDPKVVENMSISYVDTSRGFLPRLDGRTDRISNTNPDMHIHSVCFAEHTFTQDGLEELSEKWYSDLSSKMSKEDKENHLGVKFTEDGKFDHFILNKNEEPTGIAGSFIGHEGADSMAYYMHDHYWNYRRRLGDMTEKEYNQMEYDWAYTIKYFSDNLERINKSHPKLNVRSILQNYYTHASDILEKYNYRSPDAHVGVVKSQYSGTDENGVPVLHKTAPVYVTMRLYEGTPFENVILDCLEHKIDILTPKSGQKVGRLLNDDGSLPYLTNTDGTFSIRDKNPIIQKLFYNYLGKQTELSEHNEVKASQGTKIQFNNANFIEELKELANQSNDATKELIAKQTARIAKESGLTEENQDPTKMAEKISRKLLASGTPEDSIQALNVINNKNFELPLDASTIGRQIQQSLFSEFNNDFINPYRPGMAAMQINNIGYYNVKWSYFDRKTKKNVILSEEEIRERGLTQKDLHIVAPKTDMYQFDEKGNTKPIEVNMAWMFEETPEELGLSRDKHYKNGFWEIPENFIHPDLLEFIMERIPTAGMNSMHVVVSLKMFDPSRGYVVAIGSGIIRTGDSDHDGDKMMVSRRNYRKGKPGELYKLMPVDENEDSIEGKQNKAFNLKKALLSHPSNFNAISIPITIGKAKEIADHIDEIDSNKNRKTIGTSALNTHELINTLDARTIFVAAKKWLGPAARAATQHILNQWCGFKLGSNYNASRYKFIPTFTPERPIVNPFTIEDIPVLGKKEDDHGDNIATTVTNSVQAILETVKDLVSTRLGMTNDNIGAVFNYILQGVSLEHVSMLCRQPIVQDWIREKQLGNSIHHKTNVSENKTKLKDSILFERILKKYGYHTDKDSIVKYANEADRQKKIDTKYLEDGLKNGSNQVTMLIKYLDMELQGSYAFTANQAFNTDTVKPKNFLESILHQKLYNTVASDGYIINPENINNIFVGKINEELKDLTVKFKKYFTYLHPAFENLIEKARKYVYDSGKNIKSTNREKIMNRFVNNIFNVLIQTEDMSGKSSIASQAKDMIFGENSLPALLQKIKESKSKNLNLWVNLLPIIDEKGYGNTLRILKMSNTPYELELLLNELKLNQQVSRNPIINRFVQDLASYNILQSGLNPSRNNVTRILPYTSMKYVVKITYDYIKHLDSKGELEYYIKEKSDLIWDNFMRNNWHDRDVVKEVNFESFYKDYSEVKGSGGRIIKTTSLITPDYFVVKTKIQERKGFTLQPALYKLITDSNGVPYSDKDKNVFYKQINAWGRPGIHVEVNPVDNISIHPQNLPFDENSPDVINTIKKITGDIRNMFENVVSLQDMDLFIKTSDVNTLQYAGKPEFNKLPGKSNTPTMTYAGIGSRETPPELLSKMTEVSKFLESKGYILNTGKTFGNKEEGADKAFSDGATKKNLFTPEKQGVRPTEQAIAKEMHPAPDRLTEGGLKLMARNTNQVFGDNLKTPVDFVIFYAKETDNPLRPQGGTGQAVEMARRKEIPTINMADSNWREQLSNILKVVTQQPVSGKEQVNQDTPIKNNYLSTPEKTIEDKVLEDIYNTKYSNQETTKTKEQFKSEANELYKTMKTTNAKDEDIINRIKECL